MHFGVQGRSQAIASTLDCTRDFPTALGQLKYRDDPDRSRAAALDRRAQSPRLLRRAAADTKCLTPVWRTTPSYSLQTKKVTAKCARPVRSRRRPQAQVHCAVAVRCLQPAFLPAEWSLATADRFLCTLALATCRGAPFCASSALPAGVRTTGNCAAAIASPSCCSSVLSVDEARPKTGRLGEWPSARQPRVRL